jgi:1-acyl-sn-glycerol-3-phosphate acyltransferase
LNRLAGLLRTGYRAVAVMVHLLVGLSAAATLRTTRGRDWDRSDTGRRATRWWHRRLAAIIGLRVHRGGVPASGAVLVAANHVSWLDVIAIACVCPVHFVAKSEVRDWPLIGALSSLCGTVFVRRSSGGLAYSLETITRLLAEGQGVAVFPEGTTSVGDSVGPFRNAFFQAAVQAPAPVQPVALCYRTERGIDHAAAFIGDAGFVGHLLALIARRETRVSLHFCDPLASQRATRRDLAAQARQRIVEQLNGGVAESDVIGAAAPAAAATDARRRASAG